ncbi:MAG: EF-hand domain-containing protein [Sphingomonas sp.]
MRYSLLLSALLVSSAAVAQPTADSASTMARLLEADANHDGQVTRPELIGWRSANFARFDRNRDGVLSSDDVPAFLRASSIGIQLTGTIKQYDANADGRLTRAEFVGGPTPLFDMADANHDGIVSKAEVDAAAAKLRAGAQ